jgi:very-short-patch-repair endonuclease
MTESALKWAVQTGVIQRIQRGVYLEGGDPPTAIERAAALVVLTGGVASGSLAGILHGFDGVELREPYVARPRFGKSDRKDIVRRNRFMGDLVEREGICCTNGIHTVIELARASSDLVWEQILESALRKRLFSISELEEMIEDLGASRVPGTSRIRRVLELRPHGAPPTGSVLETLAVQLIRRHTSLPEPQRQVEVRSRYGTFIAFVDLAWPDVGVFIELDGQQHKNQPVYDARRETAVVAAKGWLPGRFTWHEVTKIPVPTARRIEEIYRRASLHPQLQP